MHAKFQIRIYLETSHRQMCQNTIAEYISTTSLRTSQSQHDCSYIFDRHAFRASRHIILEGSLRSIRGITCTESWSTHILDIFGIIEDREIDTKTTWKFDHPRTITKWSVDASCSYTKWRFAQRFTEFIE